MSVSLKSQKIVTYEDLLDFTGQFQGINLNLKPGVLFKDQCKRSELVGLAAANLKVRPEEMVKIAPKFITADKYVTRQELVYLFTQCFVKGGCVAPLPEQGALKRSKPVALEAPTEVATVPMDDGAPTRVAYGKGIQRKAPATLPYDIAVKRALVDIIDQQESMTAPAPGAAHTTQDGEADSFTHTTQDEEDSNIVY